MSTKPHKGTIKQAIHVGNVIMGYIYNSTDNWPDGTDIRTSSVVKVEGNEVETMNSRYTAEWANT